MKNTCEHAARVKSKWSCKKTGGSCPNQYYCAVCGVWKLTERVFDCPQRKEKSDGQKS